MRTNFANQTIASAVLLACLPLGAVAENWPNFRGPNHDGISAETGLKTKWSEPIPLAWDRNVGSAFSSFACVDGKTYTCGTEDDQQTLFCLNADNGEIVWKKSFEKQIRDPQGGDGTRATPSVHDGKVYIMGGHGRVVCFDAADGREIWSRNFGRKPQWGYSASVLVDGDLAVITAGGEDGGLVAMNKDSGEIVWKCSDDVAGYATPYPFTMNGTRYIVGFLGRSAVVAEAKSGREVWSMPWKTSYDVNAAAPIFHDNHLFLSSGYQHGSILVRLKPDGDKLAGERVWEEKVLRQKFQSPILYQGNLYSCDEVGMHCVDFMTGKELWKGRRLQHGTIALAEGNLFVLTQDGKLLIGPASPEGFEPTTEAEILSGRCWTVPVIYNGRIYARNLERLVCFNLKG